MDKFRHVHKDLEPSVILFYLVLGILMLSNVVKHQISRIYDVAKSLSTCGQVTGRLVAVMTTTPQRIEFIEPAIDSLLNQSRQGINILGIHCNTLHIYTY